MAQAARCRVVFMGTPDFARVVLEKLADAPGVELVCAYTKPDTSRGRGHRLEASAVKKSCLERGIEVRQPATFREQEAVRELAATPCDILAVAAYGLILPQSVLDIPRLAPLNVHGSLLPALRGAAPIQRAILEGWQPGATTGVSIMRMVARLDAGPVFATASTPLGEHTSQSLHDTLADMGGDLLLRVIDSLVAGEAKATPQDEALATYAAKITRADAVIDWNTPAACIHARIRAMTPWPAPAVCLRLAGGEALELQLAPGSIGEEASGASPGDVRLGPDGLAIACRDAWYVLSQVKPKGRGFMSCRDFANGHLRGLPHGICGSVGALPA